MTEINSRYYLVLISIEKGNSPNEQVDQLPLTVTPNL